MRAICKIDGCDRESGTRREALDGTEMSDEPYMPVCDNCKVPLIIHGDCAAGQVCDVALGLSELAHQGLKALGIDYIEWRKRGNQIIDEEEGSRL